MAHQPHPRTRSEGQGGPTLARGETIAAIATPAGRGGIGVVRVSGPGATSIAQGILGAVPVPRHATLASFRDAGGEVLDQGIALLFPAPHSYTGEDVLELQGHGGPVVMRLLLQRCVELGARLAEAGEFTRRAFLNDRLDLAQAESVADLIDAASAEAARSAARSLSGEFSRRVHALVDELVHLRMHVEACIDFPEEEIDASDREVQAKALEGIRARIDAVLAEATQGALLRDGLTVVLAGRPNVGKSSLLNRLAGEEVAIVSPIAGTTRDYVRATLSLEGIPVHLVDTAGLRETHDEVERIGIDRAWAAVRQAGAAMLLEEAGSTDASRKEDRRLRLDFPPDVPVVRIVNKIDLTGEPPGRGEEGGDTVIRVSARTGAGIDQVRQWLLETAGWKPHGESLFMARDRHLGALREAASLLAAAAGHPQAYELQAEDLRRAQESLNAITGEFGADDLLGVIFSRFCIGK